MDFEDFLVSNNLLPLGSVVYLLFCCTSSKYGWGFENFLAEVDQGKGIRFPAQFRVYFKYILPVIVLVIFVMGYLRSARLYRSAHRALIQTRRQSAALCLLSYRHQTERSPLNVKSQRGSLCVYPPPCFGRAPAQRLRKRLAPFPLPWYDEENHPPFCGLRTVHTKGTAAPASPSKRPWGIFHQKAGIEHAGENPQHLDVAGTPAKRAIMGPAPWAGSSGSRR